MNFSVSFIFSHTLGWLLPLRSSPLHETTILSVIITNKIVVSCNGDDRKGSNHPKVWLKIKETEKIVDCPYCERRFSYQPSKD